MVDKSRAPARNARKKSAEVVGALMKEQRESLEAHFNAGLRNMEEAFHLGEAKDAEELRTRTDAIWQKTFDCLRRTYEVQVRNLRAAMARLACPDAAADEVPAPQGR